MSEETNEYFIVLTALGQAMVAESIATGADVDLRMVAVGDADYIPTSGQTALMNERARVEITDIAREPENPGWVRVTAILPPQLGGWHIREIGLVAANGNLFAIGKMDGSYKPVYSDGMCKEVLLDLIIEVGAEANIDLIIDPHVIIATRQWVLDQLAPWATLWREHIANYDNPHLTTIEKIPGLKELLTAKAEVLFVTQAQYDALPASKLSDGKVYALYAEAGGG